MRLLHWHDLKVEIEKGRMHFGMSELYAADARTLLQGRYDLFIKGPDPPTDADVMMHPPGYSLLLAVIFKLFGDTITAWRFVQILFEAFAVVGVFYLARELLPLPAAIMAGFLVAVSPQLAHTSIVLMPDSLSVLPIVWAMALVARSYKRPQLKLVVVAGVLIGISCWMRANALGLAPFLIPLIALVSPRGKRWRYSAAFVAATILVIAPITLRNMIVFRVPTPLAIGVGHNLLTGIADYDEQHRFGLLQKDHLVNQWEAKTYNQPDYERSLYAPDGIKRDRDRAQRALAIIKDNPVWFAGVLARRVGFMMTYEQTPIVSPVPAFSHSLATTAQLNPVWKRTPRELSGEVPANSSVRLSEDTEKLLLNGQHVAGEPLFISQSIPLTPHMDHVLEMPIDVSEGRLAVRVLKSDGRTLLASAAVPDAFQGFPHDRPPTNVLQIPFVSMGERNITVSVSNAGEEAISATVGSMSLFQLGESSYTWTRVPRLILRTLQKFFTTRQMWPIIVCGLLLVVLSTDWRRALIILAVPLYYYLAQSPLHTEHRYIIANHYFLLIFAAFGVYSLALLLVRGINLIRRSNPQKS